MISDRVFKQVTTQMRTLNHYRCQSWSLEREFSWSVRNVKVWRWLLSTDVGIIRNAENCRILQWCGIKPYPSLAVGGDAVGVKGMNTLWMLLKGAPAATASHWLIRLLWPPSRLRRPPVTRDAGRRGSFTWLLSGIWMSIGACVT